MAHILDVHHSLDITEVEVPQNPKSTMEVNSEGITGVEVSNMNRTSM